MSSLEITRISTYDKRSGERAKHKTGIIPRREIISCECACDVCVHVMCACTYVHTCVHVRTTQSREGKTENTSRRMDVQDIGVSRQQL